MKVLIAFIGAVVYCWGQETKTINVLYVNEIGNTIADKAVDVAVAYVKENAKLGVNVDITKVISNRTDSVELLEPLCKTYADLVESSKSPHLVLDTTMTGLSSETVKSFSAALGLPTISGSFGQEGDLIKWRNIDVDEQKYLMQINPPSDILPHIIKDIVMKQNITNAAVLFDSSFVLSHHYKSLFQNIATRNVITAMEEANLEQQIRTLRSLGLVNFFVLGRVLTINKIFSIASKAGFFTKTFAWHGITTDSEDLKCDCKEGRAMYIKPIMDSSFKERFDLIKKTYHLDETPEVTSAFYFDLALQSFLTVKSMIDENTWVNMTDYITCDDYNGTNTPKRTGLDMASAFMKENSESPTYGPFSIISNGRSSMQFTMDMSILSFQDGKTEKSVSVATWDAALNSNLTMTNSDLMDNFTSAQVYRIVVAEQQPFIFRNSSHPKGFDGYCMDLIEFIAEELGFEYEVQLATGNIVGNMDNQGRWSGMMKDLVDKKADIGVGSISVMAERENVVDFTVPYYDLVGYNIMLKSSYVPPSLFKFLSVLEDEVWICILCAYFITSFLLWIFDKYSPYSYQNNREKYKDDEEKREFTLKESLWFCMTSLTPQGGGEAPKNLSGRLVAATWWLFGFIIIASYTANLAAFLTVSRLETTIESLDDLSKQYKVSYAPINGSQTMVYFQRMAAIEDKFYEIWKDMSLNDSLSEIERSKLAVWDYPVSDRFTKIWQAMQESGLPTSLEEAVLKVQESRSATDGYAFVGDSTDIRYQVLINCDLNSVGEEFSRKPYALAVQQGSPIKDKLNTVILQLINRRKIEQLNIKWWAENPRRMQCPDPEDPSEGISMQNIGGVFIVILVGIGLACVTLSVEYYLFKEQKQSKVIRLMGTPDQNKPRKDTSAEGSINRMILKGAVPSPPAAPPAKMYPEAYH